jgi:carnitine 3-dehydrogenase
MMSERMRPAPSEVRQVALIGTGLIGIGWAAFFLLRGLKVVAWDPSDDFAQTVSLKLKATFARLRVSREEQEDCLASLRFSRSLEEAVAGADFVQENGPENLEVKQSILADLSRLTDSEIVIASSSSGLPMSDLQPGCSHPGRLVIGHPFNPVYLVPLVEIVPGRLTDPGVVEWLEALYKLLGKVPVVCQQETPGFIANRLQEAVFREALHMINEGEATARQIDDVVRFGPGMRWSFMGPMLCYHLTGGSEGLRGFFERFGESVSGPYSRLVAPDLTPALIEKVLVQSSEAFGEQSVEELEQWRDECLSRLLAMNDSESHGYSSPRELPQAEGETDAARREANGIW